VTAPKTAAPARARRSTPAEIAATPTEEPVAAEPGFDAELDFDMSAWREQKAQQVEATRDTLLFRIADRRDDADSDLYEVEIPLLSKWRTKALRLLESNSIGGMIESLTSAAGDPELEAVLDELDADEIGAIIEHLTKASGVTPGESRRSGKSSRSTQRR
jgi:hypothetical protein